MTKGQATEIYEGLMVLLREYGLSWVIDEVQSAVTEGKTEAKEFEARQDEERLPSRRSRRASIGHVQREWTEEERLALLLNATEAAMCGPAFIASDLLLVVPEWRNHPLEFVADGVDRGRYIVPLDGSTTDRLALAQRLAGLLREVRGDLGANLD